MSETITRAEELAYYRQCDEQIAEEWEKVHVVGREIHDLVKSIESAQGLITYYPAGSKSSNYYAGRVEVDGKKLEERRAVWQQLRQDAIELDKQLYTGWSRFFLVKHIHSSQSCSSFRPTTRIGWLPRVSGLTEVEAVGEYGETLCTICYPSAPAELTTKKIDPSLCAGSGQYHSTEHLTGRENAYRGASGYCPVCLRWNTLTTTGMMRKHKLDITRRHATESMK